MRITLAISILCLGLLLAYPRAAQAQATPPDRAKDAALIRAEIERICQAFVDKDRSTLTATHGTLTLSGTTGLTFSTGDGTADATMTFTGTISAINAALNGLTFTPTPSYSGSASVRIVTNDQENTGSGGALEDDDTVNITVNEHLE